MSAGEVRAPRVLSLAKVQALDWDALNYDDRRRVGEWYRFRYLRSKWWRELRARALEECDRRCQRCGEKGTGRGGGRVLHVHHLSYAHLGAEQLGRDVEVVCEVCHRAEHGVGAPP